jgi:hypothetical protein
VVRGACWGAGRHPTIRFYQIFVLAAIAGLALACARETKHELLKKAELVTTRAELEQRLGPPDDRNKLGPIETWTYEASDGKVTFLIAGDTVQLQATSDRDPAP